ncbi:hypothetical protein [Thermomonospora umbrina]|uniref:Core-binding (CB) domain-containing protein n=1 Tax=Thermomonospora umbrina TaxID=111806 RepID=A0A3D9SY10_9ACTN|nr:hypothetical protein [Thermomonospora umbrina]REF00739.1 hypothetical protein DFJ69_6316 [Thermomonospora umbrina]
MQGSRGGRRAAQPDAGWQAPERLLNDEMAVRFIAERDGQEEIFDFAPLPVQPPVTRWLARAFARRTGPRQAVKHVATAKLLFGTVRVFAESLGRCRPAVHDVADLTPAHLQAFYDDIQEATGGGDYRLQTLRSVLRDDPELPETVRTALVLEWAPAKKPQTEPVEKEYTDQEWQQIMTAIRRDIRNARDRIRAGRHHLALFRGGEFAEGSAEEAEGHLLDFFDRTGDFPRYGGKNHHRVNAVNAFGGSTVLAARLCLTLHEMTAFALLLTALTGENFGTVAKWPAAHYRPDGGLGHGPEVALVEEVKARRGPEREHMVVPLEDLPPGLGEVLATTGEERLLLSPLKVYRLLLELSEVSRRHGGHSGAFTAKGCGPGRYGGNSWARGPGSQHVARWARDRGFSAEDRVALHVGRIRQTVIERRRRPVAHTRNTMNDQYLMPGKRVRQESQTVVAAAQLAEVDKARGRHRVPVFTAAFVARFRSDPQAASAEVGLEPEALKRLVEGDQDTALASCTDHLAGPHTPAGQPCMASFLSCLDCVNARALPHQLPVQIAAAENLAALRPHLEPAVWEIRWKPRLQQLHDIANAYTPAERHRAQVLISDQDRQTVADLLDGRWDLR